MRGMEKNADRVGGGMVGAEMKKEVGGIYAKKRKERGDSEGERERARETVLAGLTSSRWDER